jgi:4-nitrophenyl phosphatase
MYQQALGRLQTDPDQTVAIGDRLETDILGAARAGLPSVLVLSGVSTRADIDASGIQPTWVMAGIQEIAQALRGSAG